MEVKDIGSILVFEELIWKDIFLQMGKTL